MVRWDLGPLEKTKSFPLSYGGPPNNIVIDVVITQMISYVATLNLCLPDSVQQIWQNFVTLAKC